LNRGKGLLWTNEKKGKGAKESSIGRKEREVDARILNHKKGSKKKKKKTLQV